MFRFLKYLAAIAMLMWGSPAALAASPSSSAYQRASDNLALGLDKLRWGMTSEEVRRAYPALDFTMDDSGLTAAELASAWGPPTLVAGDYSYASCSFRLMLSFYHARLYHVQVHNEGAEARIPGCHRQIENELSTQYGPSHEYGVAEWFGPITKVFFSGPYNRAIGFDFWDARDIGGWRADFPALKTCQSIAVEFFPEPTADGASNPLIAPRLTDLNCEYSRISVLSREQGVVVLNMRILADGSVGSAEIVKSDGRLRLNNAALEIVQKKLQFIPAMKDGKQVEAERQVTVDFKIIYPIRGSM
jgi:TonB family protein